MGASEDFIRKATQGMATSRIQNLITNKTLKDAAIEKTEFAQKVARWKLMKEKAGAGSSDCSRLKVACARLKTLANPTTREQRKEMNERKKGNETKAKKVKSEKQYTPENPAVKKKRKRKGTGDLQQSERRKGKNGVQTKKG